MSGIEEAIVAAGGRSLLAQRLGVTVQALCQWVQRGWVPAQRAIEIEQLYGVPRSRLLKPALAALLAAPVAN